MSKKVIIIACSLLSVILIGLLLFFFVIDRVEVAIKGVEKIKLSYKEEYIELGVIVKNRGKVIDSSKYKVSIDGSVDTEALGASTINYTIEYKNKKYELSRDIEVVDDVPPEIAIEVEKVERDYCSKKIKTDVKYTVLDNYDGDITYKAETSDEENKYIITVEDSNGNIAKKELEIFDGEKPKNSFKLNGNSKISVVLNGTYKEQGASYKDGCGNKIDADIKISGEVDTAKTGTYKISYELSGENTLTRTVTVYEPSASNGSKTIYLTFDDGPGYYTRKVLDALNKYNVKATFFVTNQFPAYINLIKEEAESGHTVALHTYSHNYNIYKSVDTFMDDFNKMNEVIKSQTGSYTTLFRFPGGSSNTVSRSYSKGIMTTLAKKMTEDGYKYFDWNVSSGDASGAGSNTIYNNVIKGVNNCSKCVVLMHDIKSTTANAIDSILETLTSRGYQLLPLTESSPTAHHGINN